MAGLPAQATRWLELILRLAIASLFIYAGTTKAWDVASFERAIAGFQLAPPWMVSFLATYLPWLEIVCGLGLLWRLTCLGATALIGALTIIFILALAYAWWRGLDITCGCFGGTGDANYPWLIARNMLIAAGIGLLFVADSKRFAKSVILSKTDSFKNGGSV